MIEIKLEDELKSVLQSEKIVIVLAFTPTCGTCVVAKKMLSVVATAIEDVTFVEINLNYFEALSQREMIMSVPCIMIFESGVCAEKIYAFNSVPFLYNKVKSYT